MLELFNPPLPPSHNETTVLVAQAGSTSSGRDVRSRILSFDRTYESCDGVGNDAGQGNITSGATLGLPWNTFPNQQIGNGSLRDAKVTILEFPKFGTLGAQQAEDIASATEFTDMRGADYATNPMVLVTQKNTNNTPFNVVLDTCKRAQEGEETLFPLLHVKSYLSGIKKSYIGYIPDAKVTVLRQPKYGTLKPYKLPRSGETIFMYEAFDKEWLGKDRAEFLVEYQGKTYKVIQRIEMVVDAELSDKPGEKYYSGPCDARTHRIAIQGEVIEASNTQTYLGSSQKMEKQYAKPDA